MNKYYIPEIEEFHVGFQFEMSDTWGGWKKMTLTEEMLSNPLIPVGSGNDRVPYYFSTRVKCLDSKDIESLGWSKDRVHEGETQEVFYKDNIRLFYRYETMELGMFTSDLSKCDYYNKYHMDKYMNSPLIIKNISELKKLLKQKGISYE